MSWYFEYKEWRIYPVNMTDTDRDAIGSEIREAMSQGKSAGKKYATIILRSITWTDTTSRIKVPYVWEIKVMLELASDSDLDAVVNEVAQVIDMMRSEEVKYASVRVNVTS